MKRFLTLFLSLLCFSVTLAADVGHSDSKDVIKQKTEFVKSTQTQMDVVFTSCSNEMGKIAVVSNLSKEVKTIRHCDLKIVNIDLKSGLLADNYDTKPHSKFRYQEQNYTYKIKNTAAAKLSFNNRILFHNNLIRVGC